jgi:hypothetical protein
VGEARGKTRDAQHAQGIFTKGIGNVAQLPVGNILLSVVGIVKLALLVAGNSVNRQIAAL